MVPREGVGRAESSAGVGDLNPTFRKSSSAIRAMAFDPPIAPCTMISEDATMSYLTYVNIDTSIPMSPHDKPLVWLHGEIRTPPFSAKARIEAGVLLRLLQRGDRLSMPVSRPMSSIGARCHELRVVDSDTTWRIVHRLDEDAVLLLDVFAKKTRRTPKHVIDNCRTRLKRYDSA